MNADELWLALTPGVYLRVITEGDGQKTGVEPSTPRDNYHTYG